MRRPLPWLFVALGIANTFFCIEASNHHRWSYLLNAVLMLGMGGSRLIWPEVYASGKYARWIGR